MSSKRIKLSETEINHFKKKMTLEITHSVAKDFHPYVCVAKNTIGKTQEKITLHGKYLQHRYIA